MHADLRPEPPPAITIPAQFEFGQNVKNQWDTINNVVQNVGNGLYKFRQGKQAFNTWMTQYKMSQNLGECEHAYRLNMQLLDEADRQLCSTNTSTPKQTAPEPRFRWGKLFGR